MLSISDYYLIRDNAAQKVDNSDSPTAVKIVADLFLKNWQPQEKTARPAWDRVALNKVKSAINGLKRRPSKAEIEAGCRLALTMLGAAEKSKNAL